MSHIEQINKEKLPQHVAIIMDGNGRWAQERGFYRVIGHQHGVESVREVTEAATELGIKYLTLYAFSTENWNRPEAEINALMEILVDAIENETKTLMNNNIKLLTIGNISQLPEKVRQKLMSCIERTANNTGLALVLALSYSARWEIIDAVKKISADVSSGKISDNEITDDLFSSYLTTAFIPDPELIIRTSGEQRISNFLLWQIAYSEFYFTQQHWPEFRKESFYEAIVAFQNRERRFGKISEQIQQV